MKTVQEVMKDNALRKQLYEAWNSAFSSEDELAHFLLVEMGKKLADFSQPAPLPMMISRVALSQSDGDDWIKAAFQSLCGYRRSNLALRRFGDLAGWSPTEGAEDLSALRELADRPATRNIVRDYGSDIRKTGECANAVGDIKQLHDYVDQMRRTVYLTLRAETRKLAQAAGAGRASQLRGFLLDSKRQMVEWVRPPRFPDGEFPWIEGRLTFAADSLRAVAEAPSTRLVNDAIEFLRPVVEIELTTLDSGLADAARALDLARLVERLGALREELRERGVDGRRLAALDGDIETLVQIDARLAGLVKLHKGWQRIDAALNQVENSLDLPMEAIGRNWRVLESCIRTVYPAGCEQPLPGLDEAAATFTLALTERHLIRLKVAFPDLATLLRDRFTAIDRNLIDECEGIRKVGVSLNAVVEKIDGK